MLLAARVVAPERDVVHRPLAGRRDDPRQGLGQGAEQDVDDPLGRFDVSAGAGRRELGVDDGPPGRDDLEWPHQPRVEGDVLLDERPEDVEDGRTGDGEVGVDASLGLGRGGAEVDRGPVAPDRDPDADPDGPVRDTVVVEVVGERVDAGGDGPQRLTEELFRVILDEPGVEADLGLAEAGHGLLETEPPDLVSRDLGQKVAPALVGGPDVGQEQVEDALVQPATGIEFQRRDDQAFLEKLGGQGHGSRGHAADVGVVGPVGHEEAEPAAQEDGRYAGDVRKVGATAVRVVQDGQVARLEGHDPERGLDREGHGPEVDGDVRALGQGLAPAIEKGAGEVLSFLDVGGEGRPAQDGGHLLGDGDEDVLEQLDLDGVDALHRRPALRMTRFRCPSTRAE
jgi:hypothetical protein